jgi:hypothetical protein
LQFDEKAPIFFGAGNKGVKKSKNKKTKNSLAYKEFFGLPEPDENHKKIALLISMPQLET